VAMDQHGVISNADTPVAGTPHVQDLRTSSSAKAPSHGISGPCR
jgi:hypothetical protein